MRLDRPSEARRWNCGPQTPIKQAETTETAPAGRARAFTERLKASAQRWRPSMKTTAKALGAAALLLILLLTGPIVYRTGQRWSFYFSCPYETDGTTDPDIVAKSCWRMAGVAVMNGGKLPRP
jgi:hypothetical protein